MGHDTTEWWQVDLKQLGGPVLVVILRIIWLGTSHLESAWLWVFGSRLAPCPGPFQLVMTTNLDLSIIFQ